jgi:predicted RNase H-like nuclease (RuvC/YqgF family)
MGSRRRWRGGVREDYVEELEEEREMLEARLRRLERELEELRRARPRPEHEP